MNDAHEQKPLHPGPSVPAEPGFGEGKSVVGVSLPYDYLCGAGTSPAARLFAAALGPVEEGLRKLRSERVGCIELRTFPPDVAKEHIIDAVANVWNARLRVSIHPTLVPDRDSAALEARYPWLGGLLERMPSFQEKIVLTLHSFASGSGDVAELRRRTVRALRRMVDAAKESLPLQLALELNRAKGKVDPSTTYRGLLAMCGQVEDSRVGICWDLGHTQSNVLRGVCPPDPPAEFLRRVIHAHIHDIGPDGATHWPLIFANVPIQRYIEALKGVGYGGCCVLELSPLRFSDRLDVGESIRRSVIRLRETLGG